MTTRAFVQDDWERAGIKAVIVRGYGEPRAVVLQWDQTQPARTVEEAEAGSYPSDSDFLRLREEDARALYEGLAEHFGHVGQGGRELRRDYLDERQRVDRLTETLISVVRRTET